MAKLDNDVTDARVDHEDVEGGGFQTELTQSDIEEHVVTAHNHVERKLVGNGIEESTLARIELFLARHLIRFLVQGERQVESEGVASGDREYSGAFGSGLEATAPGQMAMEEDPTDTLGTETISQFEAMGDSA